MDKKIGDESSTNSSMQNFLNQDRNERQNTEPNRDEDKKVQKIANLIPDLNQQEVIANSNRMVDQLSAETQDEPLGGEKRNEEEEKKERGNEVEVLKSFMSHVLSLKTSSEKSLNDLDDREEKIKSVKNQPQKSKKKNDKSEVRKLRKQIRKGKLPTTQQKQFEINNSSSGFTVTIPMDSIAGRNVLNTLLSDEDTTSETQQKNTEIDEMPIVSETLMEKFVQQVLKGLSCNNVNLGMLALLEMYEQLENISIELSKEKMPIEQPKIKGIHFHTQRLKLKKFDENDIKQIGACQQDILLIMNELDRCIKNNSINSEEESLKNAWEKFKIRIVSTITNIEKTTSKNAAATIKNFKVGFTCMNTIFTSEEHFKKYFLHLSIPQFILNEKNVEEIDPIVSCLSAFQHIEEIINFARHVINSQQKLLKIAINDLKNFKSYIIDNKKIIIKKLKNEDYESILASFDRLIKEMEEIDDLANDCAHALENKKDFLSKGEFGTILFNLLSTYSSESFLKIKEYKIKECFSNWKEAWRKFLEVVALSKQIEKRFGQSVLIFHPLRYKMIGDSDIIIKNKSVAEKLEVITDSINRISLSINGPFVMLESIGTTFEELFEAHLNILEDIKEYNDNKLLKKEIIFNRSHSIFSDMEYKINEFLKLDIKEKDRELFNIIKIKMKKFIALTVKVGSHLKDSSSKSNNFHAESVTKSLHLLHEIQDLFSDLEISDVLKEQEGKIQQILSEIKELNILLSKGTPVLSFLSDQDVNPLSEKGKKELIEVIFPQSIKDLEKNCSEKLINSLEQGIKTLNGHQFSRSIQSLLGIHLRHLLKLNQLIQETKNLLVPEKGKHWELTPENMEKLRSHLDRLKSFRDLLEGLESFLDLDIEFLKENNCDLELIEVCGTLKDHYKKQLPVLTQFLVVTTPLIEKWFKQSKNNLKKSTKRIKKKTQTLKLKEKKENETPSAISLQKPLELSGKIETVSKKQHTNEAKVLPKPHLKQPIKPLQLPEIKNSISSKKEEPNINKPKLLLNDVKVQPDINLFPTKLTKIIRKIEDKFEHFNIYSLRNNNSGRVYEFQKGQKNALFHLHLIKDCFFLSMDKTPEIIKRIFAQSKVLVMESLLRSMLSARAQVISKQPEEHILWEKENEGIPLIHCHQGKKLYDHFIQKEGTKQYIVEIAEMEEQLKHCFVGRKPKVCEEFLKNNRSSIEKFFNTCFVLVSTGHLKQKSIVEKPLSTQEISKIEKQMRIIDFTGLVSCPRRKKLASVSLMSQQENIERIASWASQRENHNDFVIYAKERIVEALNYIDELIKNSEMKTDQPTVYCMMLAEAGNILTSNILHLCLDHFELLEDSKIKERPVRHCHKPSQLWEILSKKIKIDQNLKEKFESVFEIFSFESRYPFGQSHGTASRLTQIYKSKLDDDQRVLSHLVIEAETDFMDVLVAVKELLDFVK